MKILETQDKHAKLIDAQAAQIETLWDAVHVLQVREDVLLAESEAEASRAVGELSRRVGFLEGRASRD